jgi:CSLREA domain-containing protein
MGLGGLGIVLLGLLATPASEAATNKLTVTKTADEEPDGCTKSDCSLREAIIRSNKTTDVETIVLGPGTHVLGIAGADENSATTGDLDIRRPVSIRGVVGGGTTVDQNASDRVFHVVGGTKGRLKLADMTVTGGNVAPADGGGILVGAGRSASLTRSAVAANTATHGGGISAAGGLSLTDSIVIGNTAANGKGGGISSEDTNLSLARSTIAGNTSTGSGTFGGGGIHFAGPGKLNIADSSIVTNTANVQGGGIRAIDLSSTTDPSTTVLVRRSTVKDNTSGTQGGGVYLGTQSTSADHLFRIAESTISGNEGADRGGGLFCACLTAAHLSHLTITENEADTDGNNGDARGGGIERGSGEMHILASIIAGNTDVGQTGHEDCGVSGNISLGSNVTTETDCFNPPLDTDVVAANAGFLGPLQNNGGLTETHTIADGSDAVDRHDGSGCGGTDQRGAPRPSPDDCDSGAYERTFCDGTLVNVVGTPGRDILEGTVGDDAILGLGGGDTIEGKAGHDAICGGGGNDRIDGDEGDDTLLGQGGDDRLDGGPDSDTCVGGPGDDRILNCEPA